MTDNALRPGITAVILTRNEEAAIADAVGSCGVCERVVVVDSHSTDRTVEIATGLGAEVVDFAWDGAFPKKKQWALENVGIDTKWTLLLDADERVSPGLGRELRSIAAGSDAHVAYDLVLAYYFAGRRLRFGHKVSKRSFFRTGAVEFPVVDDLDAPGITEVEGHYQPTVLAGEVARAEQRLIHLDPDPLSTWVSRHNKYSDWESYLAMRPTARGEIRSARSRQGQIFDRVPAKPLVFFLYSYVLRLGFLDGRAGLDYALALSFYYWMTGAKTRERSRDVSERT